MERTRLHQVVHALKSKGVSLPCPRCHQPKFSVVGETHVQLHQQNPNFGGPIIPAVMVACNSCGYITQHASVPLGLVKPGT